MSVQLDTAALLQSGDHMTQAEFHRRYEACPDNVKFELIGGVVYIASPARWDHGKYELEAAHTKANRNGGRRRGSR